MPTIEKDWRSATKEAMMCRQLTLLAKNDFRQMIFSCEHGTIHISHQQATLCLTYADFLLFAGWVIDGNLFVLNQSDSWRVRETDDGQVELWLGSGGLRLTVMEFFAFSDLLRLTLEILKSPPKTRLRSRSVRVDPSLN
jgi:hypothetical protein